MTDRADDVLDDLFHGCALAAYLDQAAAERGWPDSEATRRRAYAYYEEALAAKNYAKGEPPAVGPPADSPPCEQKKPAGPCGPAGCGDPASPPGQVSPSEV